MWAWNREQGILKRLRLVVNTLKGVVLRLCGVAQQRPLQISVNKIVERSAEPSETNMTFRTGDLVKTTGNWEGWITLGVVYSYEDWLKTTDGADTKHNMRYVYVKPICGEVMEADEGIGGYYPTNVEILSQTTEG